MTSNFLEDRLLVRAKQQQQPTLFRKVRAGVCHIPKSHWDSEWQKRSRVTYDCDGAIKSRDENPEFLIKHLSNLL